MRCFIVLGLLLLTACGGSSSEETEPAAERPSVFDPLTDTLDRASGVQDTLNESAAERRRQLEEAEGR
jgi:hypothetical protein